MPKFEGIEFDFGGGRVYVIPPLTLHDLQRMRAQLSALQATVETDALAGADLCIDILHAALIRNYPTLTRDDVGNLLDLSNMHGAIQCAMDIDGSRRKALQAAKQTETEQGGQHG